MDFRQERDYQVEVITILHRDSRLHIYLLGYLRPLPRSEIVFVDLFRRYDEAVAPYYGVV